MTNAVHNDLNINLSIFLALIKGSNKLCSPIIVHKKENAEAQPNSLSFPWGKNGHPGDHYS